MLIFGESMKKIVIFVICSISFTLSAFAQDKLTMDQSIKIALDKNIAIITARNTSQIQDANVTSAFGNFLPYLNASAKWGRSGSTPAVGPSANGSTSVGVNAGVTLFDGLNNISFYNRAKSSAQASEYDFEKSKQDNVLIVEQAYLTVLRNRQLLAVSEENLKQSKQQLSKIEESNKVGAVAKADLFRQQVQTANDELAVITAQSNYDNSKDNLIYLLSLDLNKEYDISDDNIQSQIDGINADSLQQEMADYNQLVKDALESRPDYQSSILAKNVAQDNLTIARSGYMPSLDLNGGYGYGGSDFSNVSDTKSWNIGLTLSLPLFSGFQTSTAVQTSQLNLELADQSLEQAKRKVSKDIRTALLNLETARKTNEVAKRAVISAEEDKRIAQERYNLGANTLLDLLVATSNYVQAESNKVNTAYDFVYAKQAFKIAIGKEKY
jgi:outer membrane protein